MADTTVSKVTGKQGVTNDYDFTQEMQGAKLGEVRGFENQDGTKAYVLRTDGDTSCRQFADYVFNKQEKMELDGGQLRQVAIALAKQNGLGDIDPDAKAPANRDLVCQLRDFAKLVNGNADAKNELSTGRAGHGSGFGGIGGGNMSAGSKKALGYATPGGMGSGLDID